MNNFILIGLLITAFTGHITAQCPSSGSWNKFGGYCYRLVKGYPEDAMSWYDAEDFCRLENGTLASVHSPEEGDFVLKLAKSIFMSTDRIWLGLHSLTEPEKFRWSDGSPVDYQIWSGIRSSNKCVAMDKNKGEWVDLNCGYLRGFICKRLEGTVVPSPPPIEIYVPTGNCPSTWYQYGSKCYKFFGDKEGERKSWKDAKEDCQSMGENHELISIHNEKEQMFLTKLLAYHNYDSWIGLERSYTSRLEMWSDNSRYDYKNWLPGSDGFYWVHQCAKLMSSSKTAGRWDSTMCNEKNGYVCQRNPDPSISHPPKVPSSCKEGYSQFRDACYQLVRERQSWESAESDCRKNGGNLVSVTDNFENAFLYNFLEDLKEEFWIGFRNKNGNAKFEWSDGWPQLFLNWNQFPTKSNSPACVFADNSTRLWHTASCNNHLPYVCKITEAKPPVIPLEKHDGNCPSQFNNSMDFGGKYCYHIGSITAKYMAIASFYCLRLGSKLASFHSKYETELLWPLIGNDSTKMWIGLLKNFKGEFIWEDGSTVNFTNWATGRMEGECVYMDSKDMKWVVQKCDDAYRFAAPLCKLEKVLS